MAYRDGGSETPRLPGVWPSEGLRGRALSSIGHGIEERYTHKHRRSLQLSQNTVSRRMRSNLTRADRKTVVSLDEAKGEPDDWRFTSPGNKKIRAHYVRHRPDLYAHLNP